MFSTTFIPTPPAVQLQRTIQRWWRRHVLPVFDWQSAKSAEPSHNLTPSATPEPFAAPVSDTFSTFFSRLMQGVRFQSSSQCVTTQYGTQINNLEAALCLPAVDAILIDQSCLIHAELKAVEAFHHYATEEVIFFAALAAQQELKSQLLKRFPHVVSAEVAVDVQLQPLHDMTLRGLSADTTRLHVVVNGQTIGAIDVAQTVYPEAHQLMESIRELGWRVGLISNQCDWQTAALATSFAIDRYTANLTWQDKITHCQQEQQADHVVCYIGRDSVISADLTLALSDCPDADVVLKDGCLTDLVEYVNRQKHKVTRNKRIRSISIVMIVSGVFFL
jgi:phosphoserine phosphatase